VFGYTTLIQIEEFILENKLDAVYIIKSGAKDKYVFMSCPTLVHCVFEVDVHGSRYAAVSNYLKVYHAPTDYDDDRRKQIHVVPHMIDMPTKESVQARLDAGTLINYRSKLEIADTAFVVGRYGVIKTSSQLLS
jgi:hypothetical protein